MTVDRLQSENLAMIIPASFSILGSALMILSFLLFHKIRSAKHFQIVFYVSINDFLASIGMSLGFVQSGSFACWFQGFVTNYNFLVSIFWTTVLTYNLTRTMRMQKGITDHKYIKYLCWGLPLVVTLLPLSTNTIGNTDNSGWCFIDNRPDSPPWGQLTWVLLTFYIWLWISMILVTYFCMIMLYHSYHAQHFRNRQLFITILRFSLYPVILILTWTITSIVDVNDAVSHPNELLSSTPLIIVSFLLPALQGFMHTCVFVLGNQIIWKSWKDLIENGKFELMLAIDFPIRSSSITSASSMRDSSGRGSGSGSGSGNGRGSTAHMSQSDMTVTESVTRPSSNPSSLLSWASSWSLHRSNRSADVEMMESPTMNILNSNSHHSLKGMVDKMALSPIDQEPF